MIKLVARLKVRHRLKIAVLSNEARLDLSQVPPLPHSIPELSLPVTHRFPGRGFDLMVSQFDINNTDNTKSTGFLYPASRLVME
jgi:hypothetical protein